MMLMMMWLMISRLSSKARASIDKFREEAAVAFSFLLLFKGLVEIVRLGELDLCIVVTHVCIVTSIEMAKPTSTWTLYFCIKVSSWSLHKTFWNQCELSTLSMGRKLKSSEGQWRKGNGKDSESRGWIRLRICAGDICPSSTLFIGGRGATDGNAGMSRRSSLHSSLLSPPRSLVGSSTTEVDVMIDMGVPFILMPPPPLHDQMFI